jgi:hypothetical protein
MKSNNEAIKTSSTQTKILSKISRDFSSGYENENAECT